MSGTSDAPAPRDRLVLDLGQIAPEPRAFSALIELAGLLDRDLLGVFVEDEALHGLAGLPFARELRLPSLVWSPLEAVRLAEDFAAAALRARQVLEDQAARLGVAPRFEVHRGDATLCVAGVCRPADIVVLGAPEGPATRLFGPFARLWQTALAAEAPVMLLPRRVEHRRGPVVAVLAPGCAAGLALATRIARAAGERLLVVLPPGAEAGAAKALLAAEGGEAELHPVHRLSAAAVRDLLAGRRERLLVVDRAAAGRMDEERDGVAWLATTRRVPLLVC